MNFYIHGRAHVPLVARITLFDIHVRTTHTFVKCFLFALYLLFVFERIVSVAIWVFWNPDGMLFRSIHTVNIPCCVKINSFNSFCF